MTALQYRNRRGESVTADEALTADGVLRDGFGLRAPLLMLDSLQRAIATDARKDDTAITFIDSRGIEFVDHRIADTARALERLAGRDQALRAMWRDGRQAANEARAEMIRDMCAGRATERSVADANPPRQAASRDAIHGIDPRTISASDAQRVRDEAYEAMVADPGSGRRG